MFNLGLIPDHLVANWECFWTNKWPLYDHCQRMPLPCGQQYSHFQNSASIEEENVLRNINSIKPDVANPKIEYFALLEKRKLAAKHLHFHPIIKTNLKAYIYMFSCALKQRKSNIKIQSCPRERVVQVPTLRPRNVYCPETAHKPNFQVAVVFIISWDVELYSILLDKIVEMCFCWSYKSMVTLISSSVTQWCYGDL